MDYIAKRLRHVAGSNTEQGKLLKELALDGADEIERLDGVVQLAAVAIIACEQACWHAGQTIPGLNTEIRRIVGKFIRVAKDRGLDFESGAYRSLKETDDG